MGYLICLVVGYMIGAYLMREHMLSSIRVAARREIIRAMSEYERGLVRSIRGPAPCGDLGD